MEWTGAALVVLRMTSQDDSKTDASAYLLAFVQDDALVGFGVFSEDRPTIAGSGRWLTVNTCTAPTYEAARASVIVETLRVVGDSIGPLCKDALERLASKPWSRGERLDQSRDEDRLAIMTGVCTNAVSKMLDRGRLEKTAEQYAPRDVSEDLARGFKDGFMCAAGLLGAQIKSIAKHADSVVQRLDDIIMRSPVPATITIKAETLDELKAKVKP